MMRRLGGALPTWPAYTMRPLPWTRRGRPWVYMAATADGGYRRRRLRPRSRTYRLSWKSWCSPLDAPAKGAPRCGSLCKQEHQQVQACSAPCCAAPIHRLSCCGTRWPMSAGCSGRSPAAHSSASGLATTSACPSAPTAACNVPLGVAPPATNAPKAWLQQKRPADSHLLSGQIEELLAGGHAPHKLAKCHLHLPALAEALTRTGPLLHSDGCSALDSGCSAVRCEAVANSALHRHAAGNLRCLCGHR